ncbi:MAG: NAD(P)H-dependent glycerol-3-phosphate dehydrogenase [Dongiaceae bacterium]
MSRLQKFAVVGAGAWGTALAGVLTRAGRDVTIWARMPETATTITSRHENPIYLPGVRLDPRIRATSDFAEVARCDAALLATPSQHLRAVAGQLDKHLKKNTPVVICAKGIEQDSGLLLTEVVAQVLPGRPMAVLSGPTFAVEVARGLPTAVTLACGDAGLGAKLVTAIGTATFRPYLSDDLVGTEIGGSVKNVLAIACGICVGRKLGDNARAALMTRGLAEIMRLGLARGAKPATLMGLSGLGDLTLTCNGPQSRNMSLGIALGEGRKLADILAERRSVAEGVHSAGAVVALARRFNIEMPISEAIDRIINRDADIDRAIAGLLERPFRIETTTLPSRQRAAGKLA